MASPQWTVVVLPDDNSAARQFRVSRKLIRLACTLGLCAITILAALAVTLLMGSDVSRADASLVAKNALLERELGEMTTRLQTLEGSLADLSQKDEHYRLIAGLEPLGGDVLLAGIGGPDADTLEAAALYDVDRNTAQQAFAASTQLNSLARRAEMLSASWGEAARALSSKQARLGATPSIAPTRGFVSSAFTKSRLHPILHRPRPHMGIDIVAPVGTPVIATANGRVTSAGPNGHYGLLIEIDHGHGKVTRYAHLSRVAVKPGQAVQRGDNIGSVGTSGLSTGPHLHYEVLVNGSHSNPNRHILDLNVLPD